MVDSSTADVIVSARGVKQQVAHAGGALVVLDGVELTLHRGESAAILGASGSGKTTLLGLLAGLERASGGEISLFGQSLQALDEEQRARLRRARLGYVFQDFQLVASLSALENVMLPLALQRHPDAETSARALLERLGLGARLQHRPAQLSGGEQQRVALARAFAGNPELVLADEPTGNLDPHTGAQIIELLFELNRAQGTALLLVTHDAALAARCQRVYRLNAGRLEQAG